MTEDARTFGERFLEEWKRMGGQLAGWSYAEIQELRTCDQEGMVSMMRKHQPLTGYAALQRIRSTDDPEQLAREALLQSQVAANSGAGLWMMIALIT